jgi:hypothetical protein
VSINEGNENQDFLNLFIEQLVLEAGMTNIEADLLPQMKKDMRVSLDRRLNAAMLRNLPPKKHKKFDKMLDKETDPDKFRDFLLKNIPNFNEVVTAVLSKFRSEYVRTG